MDKYADPEQMPGEYLGLGTDPDVSGIGNKVCVVYVDEGDIICKSSTTSAVYDPCFNWHTSIVDTDASAPAVYMQGNNVYCAYVKDGDLYLKISEDGGVTWSEAEKKNDVDGTVIGEKGSVDICRSGIAFTDKRNGNFDIYFSSYIAIPTPALTITDIAPLFMKIQNVGDAAACNVSWSITINGSFIFPKKSYSGIILGTFGPDLEITVGKRQILFGFGPFKITGTACAKNAPLITTTLTGKVLGFFFYPDEA
jgi:hypothetical protein